jgi:hypothetical protein
MGWDWLFICSAAPPRYVTCGIFVKQGCNTGERSPDQCRIALQGRCDFLSLDTGPEYPVTCLGNPAILLRMQVNKE